MSVRTFGHNARTIVLPNKSHIRYAIVFHTDSMSALNDCQHL